jgi:hypothetical protein
MFEILPHPFPSPQWGEGGGEGARMLGKILRLNIYESKGTSLKSGDTGVGDDEYRTMGAI